MGHTTAPEYAEIPPADQEIVDKTLPFLPPIVTDMIRVQLFAGLRPQDVRNLRSCDIVKTKKKKVWKYSPFTHKTKNKGKTRNLAVGQCPGGHGTCLGQDDGDLREGLL